MKKQDLLSILITFAVGLFAGSYLYLTGFAQIEAEIALPDVVEASQFVVVGDAYGGCRNTCPSFQVVNDGSYNYLYTPGAGADQVKRQGKLTYELHRKLKNALIESELIRQSRRIEPSTCNSYVDGIDVAYEITLDSKIYVIDSCGTSADGQSQLWVTLSEVWSYFETLGNNN